MNVICVINDEMTHIWRSRYKIIYNLNLNLLLRMN